MLVRHLTYFVTLAKERHSARAADVCHITQLTLSAAIRRLEEDFGVPLVERGKRFVGLTTHGETLLSWSRQILTDYNSLLDDLSAERTGVVGELRLGVIPAALPAVAFITELFCAAMIRWAVRKSRLRVGWTLGTASTGVERSVVNAIL